MQCNLVMIRSTPWTAMRNTNILNNRVTHLTFGLIETHCISRMCQRIFGVITTWNVNHKNHQNGWTCLRMKFEMTRPFLMEVLIKEDSFPDKVHDALITKFVHDWRATDFTLPDGKTVKRWLRRSRLIAREYAFMERLMIASVQQPAHM